MRVSSSVDSGDTFFTDLNGFQVEQEKEQEQSIVRVAEEV